MDVVAGVVWGYEVGLVVKTRLAVKKHGSSSLGA
jgi:hypothetical protein